MRIIYIKRLKIYQLVDSLGLVITGRKSKKDLLEYCQTKNFNLCHFY